MAALVAASCTAARTAAAEPWEARPYNYLVVDQDLRTVLEEFGRNAGVRLSLSPAVQGRVKGNTAHSSARAFLDSLAQAYGLDWYYDGFSIYVSASAEARSRVLELQGVPFDTLSTGLRAAGLNDPRYQLRPGPIPTVALVSGPPRFVESVTDTLAIMAKRHEPAAQELKVLHVFRGAFPAERLVFAGADGRKSTTSASPSATEPMARPTQARDGPRN